MHGAAVANFTRKRTTAYVSRVCYILVEFLEPAAKVKRELWFKKAKSKQNNRREGEDEEDGKMEAPAT